MTKPVPARLFVLLARTAPVGVILRRGPTDWVQLIHWDTQKDIFTPGQWFHGHVYTDRCDLSPDGSLLVYFANKMTGARLKENKAIWTALSKPPYFTALKIWFQDSTWGGGGLFDHQSQLWFGIPGVGTPETLNPANPPKPLRKPGSIAQPSTSYHGVLFYRLERDGWAVTERNHSKWAVPRKWQKQAQDITLNQEYTAALPADGGSNFHYTLPDITADLSSVAWADVDQHNRLVLARDGKLFSAALQNDQLSLTELADFNAHQHEPVETPAWAQKW